MTFSDLNEADRKELLKFPAYITLLAIHADRHLHEGEKREAMKFSHIKTFTCNPLLSDFYKSAHQEFSKNIEEIERHFPENSEVRQHIIKQKLADLGRILEHMDSDFVFVFQKSMKQFKDHVSKAQRNVLEYFLFPLPLDGISD